MSSAEKGGDHRSFTDKRFLVPPWLNGEPDPFFGDVSTRIGTDRFQTARLTAYDAAQCLAHHLAESNPQLSRLECFTNTLNRLLRIHKQPHSD